MSSFMARIFFCLVPAIIGAVFSWLIGGNEYISAFVAAGVFAFGLQITESKPERGESS